jgi:hypothetical protein
MKQNIARDLLLLAAVAYHEKRFDVAGEMFAASMSSSDAMELLTHLDEEGDLDLENKKDDWEASESSDAPRTGLAAIAKSLTDAMSDFPALAADDDEEEEESSEIEDEIEEDADDADSDDFNSEVPGQKYVPSSLSSANQGGGNARKVTLIMSSASPVRIKQ